MISGRSPAPRSASTEIAVACRVSPFQLAGRRTTFTTWIVDLHTGEELGTAMRVILSPIGFAVASLSVTGVWLWWCER